MNTKTIVSAAVVALLSVGAMVRADDLTKMQGTWKGTSPEGASLVMVIKDVTAKSTIRGKAGTFELAQEIKLNESADPKTIDFRGIGSRDDAKTIGGIYKLEGDQLTVCINPFGGERPKKFAAGKDGGSLVVYSRLPEKEPGPSKPSSGALAAMQGRWEGSLRYLDEKENAFKSEEIVVEVDGNVATLSKGKGESAKVVGKSTITLDDISNLREVYSKGLTFTPQSEGDAAALRGLALYQLSKDNKSWMIAIRPDGKERPQKIRIATDKENVEQSITLTRVGGSNHPEASPATDDKPDRPLRRPSTPKRPTSSRKK